MFNRVCCIIAPKEYNTPMKEEKVVLEVLLMLIFMCKTGRNEILLTLNKYVDEMTSFGGSLKESQESLIVFSLVCSLSGNSSSVYSCI